MLSQKEKTRIKELFRRETVYFGECDWALGYVCNVCGFCAVELKEACEHLNRGCQLELFSKLYVK